MWYILAYTCETITTIKIRNLPIIPHNFLLLLQSPSHPSQPLFSGISSIRDFFLWTKKYFLLRENPQRDKIVIYLNLSKWTAGGWGGWSRRWSRENKKPLHDGKWKGDGKKFKKKEIGKEANFWSQNFILIDWFCLFCEGGVEYLHKIRIKLNKNGDYCIFAELPRKLWWLKQRNGIKIK